MSDDGSMTILLEGREIAAAIEPELRNAAATLAAGGRSPRLAIVRFGADGASRLYSRSVERIAARTGIGCDIHELAADTTPRVAHELLDTLNADTRLHGLLIQRPLPPHLDADRLVQSIDPEKDVDGATHTQIGRTATDHPRALAPCTPLAVVELLAKRAIDTRGKHVVILGRSSTVGQPLALLLARKGHGGDATVTLCHSATIDLAAHTRRADLVVCAIGRPRFLTRDHVRPDAVVVDVGINVERDEQGRERIVGDADHAALDGYCAAITPVPGGVGPVTVSMLLRNVIRAARAV
jgi:methylenetetrahydrofolate dehydrogenase (NADP+) / methenyltetrahydrofolate cyclohydrolase